MVSELLVLTLVRAQVAIAVAIAAVLVLRGPARRLIGPVLAYRLWALAPFAAATSLFPTLGEVRNGGVDYPAIAHAPPIWLQAVASAGFWSRAATPMLELWAIGAVALALWFLASELRYRALARRGLAGPAVVGFAAPRLVVPHDYRQRFTATERAFIRRHERVHMDQNHPLENLAIAAIQIIGWFNPLVHWAAATARLDQEMACDALVVDGRARDRRPYAQALLKAHDARLSGDTSALACAWSPAGRHPLELRVRALGGKDLSLRRYVSGVVAVGIVAVTTCAAVWATIPGERFEGAAWPVSTASGSVGTVSTGPP